MHGNVWLWLWSIREYEVHLEKDDYLPVAQRHAIVTLRLKKPESDAWWFRIIYHISNVSFVSQVVERLIRQQLVLFIEKPTGLQTLNYSTKIAVFFYKLYPMNFRQQKRRSDAPWYLRYALSIQSTATSAQTTSYVVRHTRSGSTLEHPIRSS